MITQRYLSDNRVRLSIDLPSSPIVKMSGKPPKVSLWKKTRFSEPSILPDAVNSSGPVAATSEVSSAPRETPLNRSDYHPPGMLTSITDLVASDPLQPILETVSESHVMQSSQQWLKIAQSSLAMLGTGLSAAPVPGLGAALTCASKVLFQLDVCVSQVYFPSRANNCGLGGFFAMQVI